MKSASYGDEHVLILAALESRLLIDFLDTGDFTDCLSERYGLLDTQKQLISSIYDSLSCSSEDELH